MGEKETAAANDAERRAEPRKAEERANERVLTPDVDDPGGGAAEAAINNTKSNIKNRGDAAAAPGGGGGGSQGIAVSDAGMPADKPRPKSN